MKKVAVIVAGGSGSRMGTELPKQFLLLCGKPILWHTLQAFLQSFEDMSIVLVVPKQYLEQSKVIVDDCKAEGRIQVVSGGGTRFHSVKKGLDTIKEPCIVFVHDGVRCMISPSLIQNCYEQALEKGSAVPVVSATDSIRIEEPDGKNKLIDRASVRLVQTPQVFQSAILLPAFAQPYQDTFTDEASVVENMGHAIHLIAGEYHNIKITRPIDIIIATHWMSNTNKS